MHDYRYACIHAYMHTGTSYPCPVSCSSAPQRPPGQRPPRFTLRYASHLTLHTSRSTPHASHLLTQVDGCQGERARGRGEGAQCALARADTEGSQNGGAAGQAAPRSRASANVGGEREPSMAPTGAQEGPEGVDCSRSGQESRPTPSQPMAWFVGRGRDPDAQTLVHADAHRYAAARRGVAGRPKCETAQPDTYEIKRAGTLSRLGWYSSVSWSVVCAMLGPPSAPSELLRTHPTYCVPP